MLLPVLIDAVQHFDGLFHLIQGAEVSIELQVFSFELCFFILLGPGKQMFTVQNLIEIQRFL